MSYFWIPSLYVVAEYPYAAQQQAQQSQQAGGQSTSNGEASNGANGSNNGPTAEDVDFEEVK